jgi:hypothetical protein
MKKDTTKATGDVADAKLFGNWFDLIETDHRTEVRGFIEPTMVEASDRLAGLLRVAPALDLDPIARFEILGQEMLELTPRLAIQGFAWPLGRKSPAAPPNGGTSARVLAAITSQGSHSSDKVCEIKP